MFFHEVFDKTGSIATANNGGSGLIFADGIGNDAGGGNWAESLLALIFAERIRSDGRRA